MTRRRVAIMALIAATLVGGGVFAALKHPSEPAPAPQRDVPQYDGKLIRFSRAFAERSKVEIRTPESSALSPIVNVTGTVTFDPQRVAAVGARIPGRVRRVNKFPGDPVAAGDALAAIESAELGQAQTAVLAARAHLEAATANEKREAALAEARVSAQRDAELARATAAASKAELHAAEQRVRALGAEAGEEIGVLTLRSPIAGKVVEAKVSRGQSVEPANTLFRVADLTRVWIELAVFERELGHVRPGDEVEITPQTNTRITLKGKVAHVGDVIDLETRSSEVRVVVENPDYSLRPGQSVLARIQTKTMPSAGILLPREAIISVDGKPTIFVAHDDTSVEPRTVVTGARDGARVEVLSGLTANERVVTGGVFALKSEIFR